MIVDRSTGYTRIDVYRPEEGFIIGLREQLKDKGFMWQGNDDEGFFYYGKLRVTINSPTSFTIEDYKGRGKEEIFGEVFPGISAETIDALFSNENNVHLAFPDQRKLLIAIAYQLSQPAGFQNRQFDTDILSRDAILKLR